MNKLKTSIAILLAVITLASCGGSTAGGGTTTTGGNTTSNEKLSPAAYNEAVSKVFNAQSERWLADREEIYNHPDDVEKNKTIIEGLTKNLDSCIKITNEIKYPDAAKEMHTSILNVYDYVKGTALPVLTKISTLKKDDAAWGENWDLFDKYTKHIDELLAMMEKAQTKFQSTY